MKIYKRCGRIDNYDKEKLFKSVVGSASDIHLQINDSDVNKIVNKVDKVVHDIRGEDGMTSIYEIRSLLAVAMKEEGYKNLALKYSEGLWDDRNKLGDCD